MNDDLNTNETKKKANNMKKLVIILIIAVIAVAAYIIYDLSSSESSYRSTKSIMTQKKTHAPKEVRVGNTSVVKVRKITQTLQFDVYVKRQINRDKSLSSSAKQQLLAELEQYSNYLQSSKKKNAYLESIEKMSMELHKLTLQSNIDKQRVQLAHENLVLQQDAVNVAKLNGTFDGKKSFTANGKKNKDTFSPSSDMSVSMIYKDQGHYDAVLNIAGTRVTAQAGATVNNGMITVDAISKQTVLITDVKTKKTYTLSLASLMGQV